jgi:hypothetical protein
VVEECWGVAEWYSYTRLKTVSRKKRGCPAPNPGGFAVLKASCLGASRGPPDGSHGLMLMGPVQGQSRMGPGPPGEGAHGDDTLLGPRRPIRQKGQ